MKRRQVLSLIAVSPLVAKTVSAQEEGPGFSKTRGFLKRFIADGQANGAIACVFRGGRLDLDAVEGWMDFDRKIPMRPDAIFNIASLSKPVTGVAAMILVEQGKLKLTDPIARWMPEFARPKVLRKPDGALDDTVPAPRAITIADLLSMHMGLGGDGPAGPFTDAFKKLPWVPDNDPDMWLRQMGELPLQFAPGERWLNDTSVDVLGLLISRVTGKTQTAFNEEYIWGPLGMKDTAFYVPAAKLSRVAGWPPDSGKPLQAKPAKFESGGDGMYSTAPDYLRFARMLRNKGELDGKRILKPESIAAMTADHMRPEEHRNGPFFDRYPGRGFGYTLASRTEPMGGGPSVGAFNWAGSTGVWFIVDPKRDAVAVLMTQHPAKGESPRTGVKYLSRIEENDAFQSAVFADLGETPDGPSGLR